jgi:hypothetical protein
VFFWRGACVGVVVGYLLAKLVGQPAAEGMDTVIVIFVAAFFAALASLPRAWIEQRNRIRALRRSSERKP